MGKLQDFRIELDRPGGNYAAGESVSGRVVVKLSAPKNVRQIKLQACGEAEVHWTKSKSQKDASGRRRQYTEHYKGSEQYFDLTLRLYGSPTGGESTTLPAGTHCYNFNFQLPSNIPCSFEHKHGHVRYTINAFLDRPWKFDHKVVSVFMVLAPYDLNAQQTAMVGIHDEIKRSFHCCCWMFRMGGMVATVKTKASGFVPGETIEMTVHHNVLSTKVNLTRIKMKLEKEIVFQSSTPHCERKKCTETIKKTEKDGPFDRQGENSLRIEVPSLPPSRLDRCSIIHITYRLRFTLVLSGFQRNVKRTYPIEIGTIPLYSRTDNAPGYPSVSVPTAPPIEHVSSTNTQASPMTSQPIGFVVMNLPPYSDTSQNTQEIPPPSYEECVSGSHKIEGENVEGLHNPDLQFAPRYLVYKPSMPMPCKWINNLSLIFSLVG
ncbi:hypothetical protein QAD02_003776 [Eretmocerus hayati]|uniref:Uncharacterized protein n=1 Tax=Eretmocerus hayati TaxID=131215 RepID=A0ACC2NN55_9HYME|nr:hypothetical protein QAD02_003776 [Eretmocerus hayati]